FPIGDLDVFLIVYDGAGVGGRNDWDITLKDPNGTPVHVHGGWLVDGSPDTGRLNNCANQTVYGMHEVFEAQSHWSAADCCDAELPNLAVDGGVSCGLIGWCSSCTAACVKWNRTSCSYGGYTGDGSYGISTMTCPNGKKYAYQLISPG